MRRKISRIVAVAMLIAAFAGTFFIFHSRYVIHTVSGTSMEAALADGDRVLIQRKAEITRYAIIAFKPDGESDLFVKRVVGLPGDQIVVQNQTLILDLGKNGEFGATLRLQLSTAAAHELAQANVIPEGCYFVLGDHIDISKDSRELGLVKRTAIEGTYKTKIW